MRKIVLGLAPALVFLSATAASAAPPWRVSEISGTVRLTENGKPRAAMRGSLLSSGAIITTGAGARAVLVRGEEFVVIAPGSQLRVPAAAQAGGVMQMIEDFGTALFKINKKSTPHFGVQTPYLAAVVKGTTFTVTVGAEGGTVQVTEGSVEVSTLDGGASDLVTPGVIASVGASDLYQLRVEGDVSKLIRSDKARVSGQVTTRAVPYRGPAAAIVQIAAPVPELTKSLSDVTDGLLQGVATLELASVTLRDSSYTALQERVGAPAPVAQPVQAPTPDTPSSPPAAEQPAPAIDAAPTPLPIPQPLPVPVVEAPLLLSPQPALPVVEVSSPVLSEAPSAGAGNGGNATGNPGVGNNGNNADRGNGSAGPSNNGSGPATQPVLLPVAEPITAPVEPIVLPIVAPVVSPVEPILQPAIEPVEPLPLPVDQTAVPPLVEPVVEPVTEPAVEAVVDPVVQPVLEPVADGILDPVVGPIVEPILEPIIEPIVELVQPIIEPVVEPVAEPIAPIVEPIPETDGLLDPIVEPILDPIDPLVQPIVEPVLEPILEPVIDPILEPLEPLVQPIVDPDNDGGLCLLIICL